MCASTRSMAATCCCTRATERSMWAWTLGRLPSRAAGLTSTSRPLAGGSAGSIAPSGCRTAATMASRSPYGASTQRTRCATSGCSRQASSRPTRYFPSIRTFCASSRVTRRCAVCMPRLSNPGLSWLMMRIPSAAPLVLSSHTPRVRTRCMSSHGLGAHERYPKRGDS